MEWFPDWRGQTAVIMGCGPSLTQWQVNKCRDTRTIATNRAFELAPWANVLYACDERFWNVYPKAKEFEGLKVTQADVKGVLRVNLKRVNNVPVREIVMERGTIGGGGNSGFQAMNLAIQFGAKRIILIGFDMHTGKALHFHGRHRPPLVNPNPDTFRRWMNAFRNAREKLKELGVEVINCTPGSEMRFFPMMDLEDCLTHQYS